MAVPTEAEHAHFNTEEAMNHVLVYVDWEVIRTWKRGEGSQGVGERRSRRESGEGASVGGPEAESKQRKVRCQPPYVYGSGNTTFRSYVKSGAVLWIWTCPEYSETPKVHRLPPSLVARLHVMDAVPWKPREDPSRSSRIPAWFPERWRWIGIACPECSVYLPVNNVYERLGSLYSRNKKGEERRILPEGRLTVTEDRSPYYALPSRIRFPRRLGDRGLSDLIAHGRAVESRRTVFVSYCRRDDRNNFTGRLVEAMTGLELAPWLDMKAIPDRVATGRTEVDEGVLEQIFSDGIRQARAFVALVGSAYRQSRYAMEEWDMARRAEAEDPEFVRVQVSLEGCRIDEPGAPMPIEAGTPAGTAKAVSDAMMRVAAG